jgi:hypothetical protein
MDSMGLSESEALRLVEAATQPIGAAAKNADEAFEEESTVGCLKPCPNPFVEASPGQPSTDASVGSVGAVGAAGAAGEVGGAPALLLVPTAVVCAAGDQPLASGGETAIVTGPVVASATGMTVVILLVAESAPN